MTNVSLKHTYLEKNPEIDIELYAFLRSKDFLFSEVLIVSHRY